MSAVKILALGVLMTGTLASSTLAGSIQGGPSSPTSAAQQTTTAPTTLTFAQPIATSHGTIATQNLAGSWVGFGPSTGGNVTLGSITSGGSAPGGSLVLGTSSSINFGGATFQPANSVPGSTAP
jgi:hypothetical protein